MGLQSFYDLTKRIVAHSFEIKYIRLDNGTEYKTSQVVKFLQKYGIVEDNSPPHTSPLNGVAERFLRTLQNCIRTYIADSGFP